jgi:integral membrane protein (TIGR01906 family)
MAAVTSTIPQRVAALVTAAATAVVIVAVPIPVFLTPQWVAFEQGRTGASALSGFAPRELSMLTDSILHDLVFGGDFAVTAPADGRPVLDARERAHMIDVRGVFRGFALLAVIAAAVLVAAVAGAQRMGHPERAWRAVRSGSVAVAVGVVIAGGIAVLAFDAAFEVFHRLFFPGGSYTFDPGTERLVQLFPFAFWSETTIALGAVILLLAALVFVTSGRLLGRPSSVVRPAGHARTEGVLR